MILSAEQTFSEGQVVTATGPSTNVIDLGATGTVLGGIALVRDIGKGRPIPIIVQLDADATGTTPTLEVRIQVDDNEGFSSPRVVGLSPQFAGGVAGDRIGLFYIPEGTNERYVRLLYTVGGTTPEYTVTAAIVLADQTAPMVSAP